MSYLKNKIILAALFLLLIFLSFAPRSVELLNKNYIFLFDQGRDLLAAKDIVVNHKFTLIGAELGSGSAGFSYLFHGPGYYYLLTIPFIIFQGDPYGTVVLMWSLSIAAIIGGFIAGKKIFSYAFFGLITALLIAASPPLISQARFAWAPYPATLFIILSVLFTYLIPKRSIFIFLAAFFAGFVYHFELAVAAPFCLSLFISVAFVLRIKSWKKYFALFSGFFLAFLPMLLFELRHGFQGSKNLFNYLTHPKIQNDSVSFLTNLNNHLYPFIHNLTDTFPAAASVPLFVLVLIIFAGSIYFLRKDKNKNRQQFIISLLLLPIVSFVVFLPLKTSVFPFYLIHLNIAYILLFAYVLHSAWQNKNMLIFALTGTILLIFSVNAATSAVSIWQHDWNDYGNFAKIKGKKAGLDYIYQDAGGEKFNLLIFSPPIYTYPYDYLVWWYGEKKYGFVPGQEKKGTAYLLIEPDSTKPWSYKGWLETVIATGKVLKTTTLPSGLIIQKREFD